MPTLFSHPAIPLALGFGLGRNAIPPRLLGLGVALSVLPDLDVLAFRLGIRYASPFGHRGFTHSLALALAVALLCALFHRKLGVPRRVAFAYCAAAMASHPLLDALTDGGLGVALWWPFSNQRVFLPWHPIAVSPIGTGFFSAHGWAVLQSELYSVWLPAGLLGLVVFAARHAANRRKPNPF
ncbi:MAG: metal-dependent hydrolase [Candidatus Methylumidiphilus sp.]